MSKLAAINILHLKNLLYLMREKIKEWCKESNQTIYSDEMKFDISFHMHQNGLYQSLNKKFSSYALYKIFTSRIVWLLWLQWSMKILLSTV